jgi:hypothetical protein
MGVSTDATAVPFKPLPPQPGVPPSGIAQQNNIRGIANQAKKQVSERQQRFLSMASNNATPSAIQTQPIQQQAPATAPTAQGMYVQAAMKLADNHDVIDRFVDWVLFR